MSDQFPSLDWIPKFTFVRRPMPVPPDLRPAWKLLTLCLILARCCRGQKAHLNKLFLLSWCLKSEEARSSLLSFLDGKRQPESVIIHIDPSVNRALDFGIADGIFSLVSGKIALTDKGKLAARELEKMTEVLDTEKRFLSAVGNRLTDDTVKQLTGAKAT